MRNQTISLVICAYNEENYIGACLDYARINSGRNLLEIIVIDNASTDRTAEIAQTRKGVRVVREEKKGLTRARQRGFEEAKGDIIAYIDADTLMMPNWTDTVRDEFKKNTDLAVLSGPYIYYDVGKYDKFLVQLYWYLLALPVYWLVGYMVIGGNFAVRKTVLEKMNGFDTTIEFYGEDTDIARRASKFGKVKFKPDFLIYTSGRRLENTGIFSVAFMYIANFLSEVIFHSPAHKNYTDIR